MTENVWRKARKKPVIVEWREVKPKFHIVEKSSYGKITTTNVWGEELDTGHGKVFAYPDKDFVIRDELGGYPIQKELFYKTYSILYEVTDNVREKT